MKLLQELVNQADLQQADGSDAGAQDVQGKGAEVKFNLMRNAINSDSKVKGSDVANYLERAHELNDEVETVLYGLETSDGDVVKVYVNASQADAFEGEMKKMLGMEDDIEEAINALAAKFDIVDVIWPKGKEGEGETPPEEDINLDTAADIGNPDDAEPDDDLEVIASVDDEEREGAAPPGDDSSDDAPIEDEPSEDAPRSDNEEQPKKKKKPTEGEEGEAESEAESEGGEEPPKKNDKKDKKDKKGDKHSLLKSIGGGLAGKEKVAEGEVVYVSFGKKSTDAEDAVKKAVGGVTFTKGGIPPGAKPLTMLQAFGSAEMNAAHEAGIKLTEKPSYWEDFEGDGHAAKHNLTDLTLKKLEKSIGTLKTYSGKDIYDTNAKPRGPLAKVAKMPAEDMFIIKFDDGSRYVADQTGASTYIRNWQKIN